MKTLLAILPLLCLSAATVFAQGKPVTNLYAGANGIWFSNGTAEKADVEAAGNASMSLSPHLSAVGSVDYGFAHSYIRSSAGARVTASDVQNPDFSIGLGIQYHFSSVEWMRPNEWAPDASFGWRPWPGQYPRISLTGLAWYGLESQKAACNLGVRYKFSI
jgi:hypothetical protein